MQLAIVEAKKRVESNRAETDYEIEARFAELRRARTKERFGPNPGGSLTYGDTWDEITDEEIDYYMRKALRPSPEQRYQQTKAVRYMVGHDHACNRSGACVPTCRFYPEYGHIEDDEVIAHYEGWKKKRDSTTREEKRERRQRVHYYTLVYDDDTDEQRIQRRLQHEKYIQEHPFPWF